ncbi:MAG TPA: acyl-CoA dehydrogenase family protein [Candidatus Dormibacteraeota bacterium]
MSRYGTNTSPPRGRIERYLRDAIPVRVFLGTSEIQRNNIARALGLGG